MDKKQKARELFDKMLDSIKGLEGQEWWDSAKQCALIAVRGQIKENESILEMAKRHMDERASLVLNARILEQQEIEREIENL